MFCIGRFLPVKRVSLNPVSERVVSSQVINAPEGKEVRIEFFSRNGPGLDAPLHAGAALCARDAFLFFKGRRSILWIVSKGDALPLESGGDDELPD